MGPFCVTRAQKNAKRLPRGGFPAVTPLFNGTLHFIQVTFDSGPASRAVLSADLMTALQFSHLIATPVSQYASQYGPNSIALSDSLIQFSAPTQGGKYSGKTLAGWVDTLATQQALPAGSCLVFLNPQGVINTDADASQGVLGYHSVSPSGFPYVFVNVMGTGLTIKDENDFYALALSHEIAEMVVDPAANADNPEVCDECAGNCGPTWRNYFDSSGTFLVGTTLFPLKSDYAFFINSIVQPAFASDCPAPQHACAYAPPAPIAVAKPSSIVTSTKASEATGKISHVVIIMKENHTFDNYFGTFPGANGVALPRGPNPPPHDYNHSHAAWLTRAATSEKTQFVEQDIPAYFAYARQFALCDNYYTDVAGPSTPNHLMVVAADSPVIDNPKNFTGTPSFMLPASLPLSLERAGRTWRSYGGFATKYCSGINASWRLPSAQFAKDAAAGTLADVSWVWAGAGTDEHPPDTSNIQLGNVTVGMQWTVDQINAIVKGGLWPNTAIFVTWDDWGGWYDHVDPPEVEVWNGTGTPPSYAGTQFRYGSRVPCLVLGPYVKPGYISKTLHSHVSLIKFCETLFGVGPINNRDAAADDMSDCFDYTRAPGLPPP